jgi:hypothetical protein
LLGLHNGHFSQKTYLRQRKTLNKNIGVRRVR